MAGDIVLFFFGMLFAAMAITLARIGRELKRQSQIQKNHFDAFIAVFSSDFIKMMIASAKMKAEDLLPDEIKFEKDDGRFVEW